MFWAGLNRHKIAEAEHHDRTAFIGFQTFKSANPSGSGREKLPATLIPAQRHLPQRCGATGELPAFSGIVERHFKYSLASQATRRFGDDEIGSLLFDKGLRHPQARTIKSTERRRGIQQKEAIANLSSHGHVQRSSQTAIADLPVVDHRFRRLQARDLCRAGVGET